MSALLAVAESWPVRKSKSSGNQAGDLYSSELTAMAMMPEILQATLGLVIPKFPPRFAIGFKNLTENRVRIWPDTFPDGYDAPMLQLSRGATGPNWVIVRKGVDWTVTKGNPHEIGPGQTLKLNYDLSDGSWVLPARVNLVSKPLWIRAILVYRKCSISERFNIFSGALATTWCSVPQ